MKRSDKLMFGIGTSYLYFIINILMNIILVPIMLHFMGREEYGLWMTIISIVGYVGVLDFGVAFSVSKYVAEYYAKGDKQGLGKMLSTSLLIYSVLGSLALIVVVIISALLAQFLGLSGHLADKAAIAFLISGMNLAVTFPSNVIGGVLAGHQKVAQLNITNIIAILMNSILSVISLWLGFGVIGIAFVLLLSGISVTLMRLFYIFKSLPEVQITYKYFDRRMLGRILSFSFFMFVLSIGGQIVFNTDNIVIAKFIGVAAVTAYAIAFKVNQYAMAFINKLSDVFFTFYSELEAIGDKEKLKIYFLESAKMSMAIAVPIIIILLFWGASIIGFWVGNENFVGMSVLYVLIAITFMSSVIHPCAIALQGIGKIKDMVWFNIFEASCNIVLSILLALKIGVLGVALGTLLSMSISNLWYVPFRACRELGVRYSEYIYEGVILPLLIGGFSIFIAFVLNELVRCNNLIILLVKSVILIFVYLLLFLYIGLTAERRKYYLDKFFGIKEYLRGRN